MRVHLVIDGFVQGVGYRWSAQRQARALGLTGWVRNRHDGTVEAVADGDDERVGAFIRWCHDGPPGAQVGRVAVEALTTDDRFADFSIRH